MTMTTLIADRAEMRRALLDIQPTHIAVAYVGEDWRDLLGAEIKLREIIVAPVPGTNPKAIRQIARRIGWQNVHFFDQLHAKVYLGETQMMLGSANLSSNALLPGGTQLYEMGVLTDDPVLCRDGMREWERYRALALSTYRSKRAKLDRLIVLEKAQPKIAAARVSIRSPTSPKLAEFDIDSVPVHLEWWESDEEHGGQQDDTDYINTRAGKQVSEINIGNWVLQWKCDKTGRPSGGKPLTWMRIDEIRMGGAAVEPYYVDQLVERVEPTASMQPFVLDAVVQREFKKLMANSRLRPDGTGESVYEAIPLAQVKKFLRELQSLCR